MGEQQMVALLKEQREDTLQFLVLISQDPTIPGFLALVKDTRRLLQEVEALIERMEHTIH